MKILNPEQMKKRMADKEANEIIAHFMANENLVRFGKGSVFCHNEHALNLAVALLTKHGWKCSFEKDENTHCQKGWRLLVEDPHKKPSTE